MDTLLTEKAPNIEDVTPTSKMLTPIFDGWDDQSRANGYKKALEDCEQAYENLQSQYRYDIKQLEAQNKDLREKLEAAKKSESDYLEAADCYILALEKDRDAKIRTISTLEKDIESLKDACSRLESKCKALKKRCAKRHYSTATGLAIAMGLTGLLVFKQEYILSLIGFALCGYMGIKMD